MAEGKETAVAVMFASIDTAAAAAPSISDDEKVSLSLSGGILTLVDGAGSMAFCLGSSNDFSLSDVFWHQFLRLN